MIKILSNNIVFIFVFLKALFDILISRFHTVAGDVFVLITPERVLIFKKIESGIVYLFKTQLY